VDAHFHRITRSGSAETLRGRSGRERNKAGSTADSFLPCAIRARKEKLGEKRGRERGTHSADDDESGRTSRGGNIKRTAMKLGRERGERESLKGGEGKGEVEEKEVESPVHESGTALAKDMDKKSRSCKFVLGKTEEG